MIPRSLLLARRYSSGGLIFAFMLRRESLRAGATNIEVPEAPAEPDEESSPLGGSASPADAAAAPDSES